MTEHTMTITMDGKTQAFYHGVALANETREMLKNKPGFERITHEQLLSLFFLTAGVNADRDIVTDETFDQFVAGLTTRAPQREDAFVLEMRTADAAFGDPDGDESGEQRGEEVGFVLTKLVRSGRLSEREGGPLLDSNGATCGWFKFFD